MNAFLVFKQGYHDDEPHAGIYGRRPLACEPAGRLASLPKSTVIFGDLDWFFARTFYFMLATFYFMPRLVPRPPPLATPLRARAHARTRAHAHMH